MFAKMKSSKRYPFYSYDSLSSNLCTDVPCNSRHKRSVMESNELKFGIRGGGGALVENVCRIFDLAALNVLMVVMLAVERKGLKFGTPLY